MKRAAERNTQDRRWLLAGAAVLLLAMVLELAVNRNLTVYSDDYWYGTFFQNGWQGFWENTKEHYQTTNGRVLIHILIPILLLADTKIYALVSPLLTALILLLGLRVQNRKMGPAALLLAAGLGLLSVLGSEIQYLRMSLYWLSAYFNYVFPLLFPLAVLWGMQRVEAGKGSRLGLAALGVCAVVAGASTEQCGLVALVVLWGYWLLRLKKGGRRRLLVLFPLLTSAGYLTVLTAPGSHARMERGIDGGVLSVLDPQVFLGRFFDVMGYLCGYGFWNLLFAVFCLLLGLLALGDRRLPRHLLSAFPAALLVVLLAAAGGQKPLAVVTVLYTLYSAVTLLRRPKYQVTGLLLLGGGASVMMLIVTTLYYARTFFPCLLLFLMVAWSLLFRVLERGSVRVSVLVCALLAAVFVVRYAPIYAGYAANRVVVEENLQAIQDSRTSGELALSIDLDADYRFTMFFEGTYFLENFLQYYEIPRDIPLRFTSQIWDVSDVQVGDQKSTFPALEKDGVLLMPLEFVFQASGNQCQFYWTDHTFAITYGGENYTLYEDGRLVRQLPEGGEEVVDTNCVPRMPFSYTYTLLYLPAEDLARCFGIQFAYDGDSDCYVFQGTLGEGGNP